MWIIIHGEILLTTERGYRRLLRTGETVLVPAGGGAATWTPTEDTATLLSASLPDLEPFVRFRD